MAKRERVTAKTTKLAPEVLAELNVGTREARNLAECLAVDFAALLPAVVPDVPAEGLARLSAAAGLGIVARMQTAAELALDSLGPKCFDALAAHPSDTVRGWACFVVARLPRQALEARLKRIRPLADDAHFGVREWAWLALRPHLAAELPVAFERLAPWTAETSPRLRRFASEATRPRGVWCAHLEPLKRDPRPGLVILEPLRADPEKYVQDSVANWLNDAGKSQPDWLREVAQRWRRESPTPSTTRILARGLRSLPTEP